MSQETKTSTQDPLVGKITDQVAGLEKLVDTQRSQDDQRVATSKKALVPLAEKAKSLKTEYESLLERFGPALARMQALDIGVLRSFSGYNLLGNIVEDAKQLHQAIKEAIARVGHIPGQVEALKFQDLPGGVPDRIRHEIDDHTGGPGRMKGKVEELLQRMEKFERARQA